MCNKTADNISKCFGKNCILLDTHENHNYDKDAIKSKIFFLNS